MSRQSLIQVDAFTNSPFAGNPAGVCVLTQSCADAWMQKLAQETNLPATVFVWPHDADYTIRWFTPSHELPLCGHGTLAAAHTLWTEGHVSMEQALTLHYRGGILTAECSDAWIRLDFPAIHNTPAEPPLLLLQGLGVAPGYVGRSSHSYLVELASESEVRALTPDISLLAQLDIANVIVTSRADTGEYDFVSRFFAPSHGIAEDAVTGSAHCCLAPYWAARLGKMDMTGYQASARGGVVQVGVRGERVRLGGQAVTILRGELSEAVQHECA